MGDLEEIDDFTGAEAVYEVPGGAAKHEGETEAHERVREPGVEEIDKNRADAEEARYDEKGAGILENAKGRAGVREVDEANLPAVGPGLAGIEADAVILATGSVPLEPRALPGADASGIRLATAADVIGGAAGRGARHAVIAEEGGGRNGLAAAEVLAEAGVRVTIVSGDMAIAEHINGTVRTQLYRFLLNRDVVFRPMEKVTEFEPGRVLTRNIYTRAEGVIEDVDLFVDWRGNQVNAALEDALRARFAEVHVIGDCLAPRTVQLAIAEGTAAADALG